MTCVPMAWANSAATTEESTPPDRPQITRPLAHAAANALDGLAGEIAQLPRAVAMADRRQEVAQDLRAQRRVRHLGMELQAVDRQRAVLDGREGAGLGGGQRQKIVGDRRNLVAVAHPHLDFLRQARRKARRRSRCGTGPGHIPAPGELSTRPPRASQANCMP